MEADHDPDVIPLRRDIDESLDSVGSVAGPVVTPRPVPADDMVLKLSLAGAAGAIVGSLVAYRWLSRRITLKPRR